MLSVSEGLTQNKKEENGLLVHWGLKVPCQQQQLSEPGGFPQDMIKLVINLQYCLSHIQDSWLRILRNIWPEKEYGKLCFGALNHTGNILYS